MILSKSEPNIEELLSFPHFLSCSNVQLIEYEYRCDYVQNTTECQDRKFFFNYIEILYCSLAPNSDGQLYAFLMLFGCLIMLLFLVLGTTADKFFCPALEMLAKVMGLSEHLAGITLLAFGNGSPDLFTSLASLGDDSITLFSNIFSSGIFVLAFVSGLICVTHPFYIHGSNLLRDTTFFLLGILYIDYAIESDGHITRLEAICILSIYLVYLAVVLIDQYLVKRSVNKMETLMSRGRLSVQEYKTYTTLRQEASIDILGQTSHAIFNIESTRKSYYGLDARRNSNLIQQLCDSLNPIDKSDWLNSGWFGKTLICVKAPIIFLLTLFIPNVSYELERHGWSKLLNCIQLVILPFTTVLLIFEFKSWLGLPICVFTLIFTIPLAVLIFAFTRTDRSPDFHVVCISGLQAFAVLAAYGAMFTIYTCASEIVEILYVLGLVLDCSSSFLGCTLLAWGNGVGDLVSNLTLSFHGYQKMAFAACYGGPFFNTLLGLGLVMLIKTFQSETGQVRLPAGPLGENCFIFLNIILFGTLMWSTTTNFHVRRSVGIFNIIIYVLFVLYTILAEMEVIQTYADVGEYGVGD